MKRLRRIRSGHTLIVRRNRAGLLRRVLALGLVLASMVALAACTSSQESPTGESPSQSVDDLSSFYDQDLAWAGCEEFSTTAVEAEVLKRVEDAQCARMRVPIAYDNPTGPTASVAVIRVPAKGERLGSLVYNPGGPGGSGIANGAALAIGLANSPIAERFDLVSFDPRGVGVTQPAIDCWSENGTTRGDAVFPTLGPTTALSEGDTKALVDRCAQGPGGRDALGHVGTMTTVRDLDVLRAVLGDEKLSFLGQSYGTRLGAVYAEMFPDRVRAMILDGAFDPQQGTYQRRLAAYAGFQGAFETMAASCAESRACPLGQDPKQWTKRFQTILRPLIENPVPARQGILNFDDALSGVTSGLYSPAAWPRIIKGLTEVQRGRGDILLGVKDSFEGQDDEGGRSNFPEANYAINCMDEQRLSPAQSAALRLDTYRRAPIMDPGNDDSGRGARDVCEFWPAEPTLSIPYAQNAGDQLPATLVVSITDDPTTPHAGAINLAKSLKSSLLTVEGQGHTIVSLGSSKCVDAIAATYLIEVKVPEKGAACTL